MMLEIIFALSIVILLQYLWGKRKEFILAWHLPGPFAWPIFGNAFKYLGDDKDAFDKSIRLVNSYPSPMRLWFGPKLVTIFSDVNQAEKILTSTKLINKDEIYRFLKEFNGEGLITGSGMKWKSDRRLLSPLFVKKNTSTYFSCIVEHTNGFIKMLDKEKLDQSTFNIKYCLQRCVADFVNESLFGIKSSAQSGELDELLTLVIRMYQVVYARIVKVWLQIDWIFRLTQYGRDQEVGKKVVYGFMKKALNLGKERHSSSTTSTPSSFLDQMLLIRDRVDYATDEEMVHHLTTLYTASEDTVTQISSFTLVLLGMYPEIQQKVVDEIDQIIGLKNDQFNEDDMSKLEYLDMCIKDVLRLYPIAPFIIRFANEDVKIDDWVIPAGCSVMVPIHNIHRNPKYWQNPNEFWPEHFLPSAVENRSPYAFLPFSAGPRGCSGKSYATLAMKIILIKILQSFVVESDGRIEDKQLKADISVRFRDDYYPLRIKRR